MAGIIRDHYGNASVIGVTCVAPTKAFNLAGLQTAAVIVPDENIRYKVNRGLNTDEVAEPNILAAIAPAAAFERLLDRVHKEEKRINCLDYLVYQMTK